MVKNKINDVYLLLSKLDRKRIEEFIKQECREDEQLADRFLALGAGTVFEPSPETYSERIHNLIADFSGKYGYVEYRDTFDFNRAVSRLFDEADDAARDKRWRVVTAILTGIANCCEDILNSGDDSAGELGAIVDECFEKWHELVLQRELPEDVRNSIFELALKRFEEKDLQGWDWWWSWVEIAIELSDDAEKQGRVVKALKAIRPEGNDWRAKYHAETAQSYLLKIMAKCGTHDEQCRFMYDHVSNPDFRTKLMEMAWNEKNYDEVLRLAKEGEKHDSEWAGLVSDWRKWQFKVYRQNNDRQNMLSLAKYFFFGGDRVGETEYSIDTMYSLMKSLMRKDEWPEYVESLLQDKDCIRNDSIELYIYTQEGMWDRYMEYLRKKPSTYALDDAPKEVLKLYKTEFIELYAKSIRHFFVGACTKDHYREGARLLKKLIKYGGGAEAKCIIVEQKDRRPRRPALIEELSKI